MVSLPPAVLGVANALSLTVPPWNVLRVATDRWKRLVGTGEAADILPGVRVDVVPGAPTVFVVALPVDVPSVLDTLADLTWERPRAPAVRDDVFRSGVTPAELGSVLQHTHDM